MDVLPHRVEAGLDACHVVERILARNPVFEAAVGAAVVEAEELRPAQARIERQPICNQPGLAQENCGFKRILLRKVARSHQR